MKLMNLKLTAIFFTFIGLASCEKGDTCKCTSTYSNGDPDFVQIYESADATANPNCDQYELTTIEDGDTTNTTCLVNPE